MDVLPKDLDLIPSAHMVACNDMKLIPGNARLLSTGL